MPEGLGFRAVRVWGAQPAALEKTPNPNFQGSETRMGYNDRLAAPPGMLEFWAVGGSRCCIGL